MTTRAPLLRVESEADAGLRLDLEQAQGQVVALQAEKTRLEQALAECRREHNLAAGRWSLERQALLERLQPDPVPALLFPLAPAVGPIMCREDVEYIRRHGLVHWTQAIGVKVVAEKAAREECAGLEPVVLIALEEAVGIPLRGLQIEERCGRVLRVRVHVSESTHEGQWLRVVWLLMALEGRQRTHMGRYYEMAGNWLAARYHNCRQEAVDLMGIAYALAPGLLMTGEFLYLLGHLRKFAASVNE